MWLFKGREFTSGDIPNNTVGFIYRITNNQTGLKYIGQKRFYRTIIRLPLKGTTKKRKSIVESDWKKYVGSSVVVQQQVKDIGIENFTREILAICYSKGMLNYTETEMQFKCGVLFDPTYLNGIINCRINKTHVILSQPNIT